MSLPTAAKTESSVEVRERVINARELQNIRFSNQPGIFSNAQMGSSLVREVCTISQPGQNLLRTAMQRLNLSARAYDRILKVSRTIGLPVEPVVLDHRIFEMMATPCASAGRAAGDGVAELLEGGVREEIVDDLGFLQAENVRRLLLQEALGRCRIR